MLKWLKNILITEGDDDPAFVRMIINTLIVVLIILVLLAITQSGVLSGSPNFDTMLVLLVVAVLTGFFIFLTTRKVLWPSKLFLPTTLLFSLTYFIATENGLHDVSVIGFPAVLFLASLLFGSRLLIFWAVFSTICIGFVGYWDIAGYTPEPIARTTGIDTIAIGIAILSATTGITWVLLKRFEEVINAAKNKEREQIQANEELRELQKSLETRIEERTHEFEEASLQNEHRAQQFEAIALVSKAITSIRTLDEMLPRITELISQHFGYYHVGIFLNDTKNENALLRAANSDGGKHMILRGHQLRIGEQGIVGFAINTGEPRIALDVGEDATYFGNPELPDTRSEMALPLKIGNTVIGALDVQSAEASAFSEEDMSVLSLLADQASMAIENARLFDQARKSLAESEALYRQYLRQAWNRLPKEQNLAGFRYNARGASPIENKLQEDTSNHGEEVSNELKYPRITVPIALRGETIGTLAVQVPEANIIDNDQMDLVKAVAERVALSAENARLFEETTRRAERERLVSDITVKIRSTNDPDVMIETAIEELKQALGATKVQLIPHTLQRTETKRQALEPSHQSNSEPNHKGHKE